MRKLTEEQHNLLSILEQSALPMTGAKLAECFGDSYSMKDMSRIISQIRKRFRQGDYQVKYVYTTTDGYTVHETTDNVIDETKMRLRLSTSILKNGTFVFKRCKRISLENYNTLTIAFKPKLLEIEQLL